VLRAVYYPHTAIHDENFLKHALLYWDEVQFISPWQGFNALPRYSSETARALAKFLKPHVPTKAEKEKAHDEIMKLIRYDLPSWLKIERNSSDDDYDTYQMFRGKLLPETWQELKTRGAVQFRSHGGLDDYASHTYLGLTLMAILARSCAGTLKHTITDREHAYGSFLRLFESLSAAQGETSEGPADDLFKNWLEVMAGGHPEGKDTERERLVAITLEVIDAESLPIDDLIRLRTDKTKLASLLRRNYAEAIEKYVSQLSAPGLSETDANSLRTDFREKMVEDLERLYQDLKPIAKKIVLSKEVAVAFAAPIVGPAIIASGVGVLLGGALALGALGKLKVDYASGREAAFLKHPMAFLYAAKGVRFY